MARVVWNMATEMKHGKSGVEHGNTEMEHGKSGVEHGNTEMKHGKWCGPWQQSWNMARVVWHMARVMWIMTTEMRAETWQVV